MKTNLPTQCEALLKFLRKNGSATKLQVITQLGIINVGARIEELRKEGHNITTEWVTVKTRWGKGTTKVAQYTLHETVRKAA